MKYCFKTAIPVVLLLCQSSMTLSVTLNQNFTQQAKVVGSGYITVYGPFQGTAVALSGDGETLACGGPYNNYTGTTDIGATWVFTQKNSSWQQVAEVIGVGTIGGIAQQGSSLALSADGQTLAIGGPLDNGGTGAVWLFTPSGTNWVQQAKLVGANATGYAQQGSSVALSADGTVLAVGGTYDNNNTGAVWIFVRSDNGWTQQGKLTIDTTKFFGSSVALSADGSTLAVGAILDNGGIGAVWVFTFSHNVWSQQAKLVGTDYISPSYQGFSVALSADGNTLASGAPIDNTQLGATWVFKRMGTVWNQQAQLIALGANNINSQQGEAVALSSDGNTLAIGGPGNNSGIGAAWIFKRFGSTWQEQSKLVGSGTLGGYASQGSSIALSQNGTILASGGPSDHFGIGAAWLFSNE